MHAVRLLTPEDAAALYALRLEALRTDPDAFLATYEEERSRGVDDFAARLREGDGDAACGVMGAFVEDALVAMVGFVRTPRIRARHKAIIWGTWVAPRVRGRGIGRALMQSALARLRGVDGIEIVELSVTTGQTAARALYLGLGFEPFWLEEHAMKDGDRYIDEEHLVLRLVR
jgi:ribosomal protein S18 acetylase RimI-like enzyme